MSPEYMCSLLHNRHVSLYYVLRSWNDCLPIEISGALHVVFETSHLNGRDYQSDTHYCCVAMLHGL
jgi:hypothetical protein